MNADELKKLAENATPGQWEWWTSNSWRRLKANVLGKTNVVIEPYVCSDGHPNCCIAEKDMDYIAAANPAAILEIIAQRDVMMKALKELRRGYEHHACWCEMAISNPMVSAHSPGCIAAREAIARVEGV